MSSEIINWLHHTGRTISSFPTAPDLGPITRFGTQQARLEKKIPAQEAAFYQWRRALAVIQHHSSCEQKGRTQSPKQVAAQPYDIRRNPTSPQASSFYSAIVLLRTTPSDARIVITFVHGVN
jgi:hypothetical protein